MELEVLPIFNSWKGFRINSVCDIITLGQRKDVIVQLDCISMAGLDPAVFIVNALFSYHL